jgi:disulfide bond formation protein DsbB
VQRILNRLFIFVLCGILLSAYLYQFIERAEPCSLCLLQRLGMIGVATAILMNLRFGIKVEHYGLAILSALMGRIVSLRQIGLHVCPEFPAFGKPVLGFDLYVWAFIVFTCSIFACAVLLILYGYSKHHEHHPTWGVFEKIAFWLVVLITFGNVINTLIDCGLTTCID